MANLGVRRWRLLWALTACLLLANAGGCGGFSGGGDDDSDSGSSVPGPGPAPDPNPDPEPDPEPPPPTTPPSQTFTVGTKAFDALRDAARGRTVPTTVHYPVVSATAGLRFPLVLFSHGAAGTRLNFQDVGRSLASHGYVVAVLEHPGSNATKLQSYTSQGLSFLDAIYAMLEDTTEWEGRPKDVSFAIDVATSQWNVSDPDLSGRIDLARVGVGGHSYGAYTTLVVGGTLVAMPSGLTSFKDPRVRAILPMSPDPPDTWAPFVASGYLVDVPMFAFSGSQDAGFDFQPSGRLVPWQSMSPPDKYHLWLQNVAHNDFSQVASQGTRARECQALVATVARTFFDGYLYGHSPARASLTESYTDSLTTTSIPDTVLYAK